MHLQMLVRNGLLLISVLALGGCASAPRRRRPRG
jgi:hypothetical protein